VALGYVGGTDVGLAEFARGEVFAQRGHRSPPAAFANRGHLGSGKDCYCYFAADVFVQLGHHARDFRQYRQAASRVLRLLLLAFSSQMRNRPRFRSLLAAPLLLAVSKIVEPEAFLLAVSKDVPPEPLLLAVSKDLKCKLVPI